MKRFLIALVVLGVVFLAGYLPKYFENLELQRSMDDTRQQLEARLAEAQDRYQASALHSELGMILIEIEQKNFGNARDRATRFFNNIRGALSAVQNAELRAKLEAILERRDEIISDLTALNPEIETKLRSTYIELYRFAAPQPPPGG